MGILSDGSAETSQQEILSKASLKTMCIALSSGVIERYKMIYEDKTTRSLEGLMISMLSSGTKIVIYLLVHRLWVM